MTEETALQTAGLGKRYGRAWALRDCTLRLPTGRIAALELLKTLELVFS